MHTILRSVLTVALTLASLAAAHAVNLPPGLAAPGKRVALTLHAEGGQLYECRTGGTGAAAWQFREPIATLMQDGKTVGRHFAGPSWESADGSAVVGSIAAQAPGATAADIPWLRLDVATRRGDGALSGITAVQRLNTRGGVLAGACDAPGTFRIEPYAADYVFLRD